MSEPTKCNGRAFTLDMKHFDVLASANSGARNSVKSETEAQAEKTAEPVGASTPKTLCGLSSSDFDLSSVFLAQSSGGAALDDGGDAAFPLVASLGDGQEPAIAEESNRFLRSYGGDADRLSPLSPEEGSNSASKKETQAEFWAKQTIHKNAIAAKLREVGRLDVAAKLEQCHTEATYATCQGCKTRTKFLNRCDRFYCPECQPGLSRDRKRQVEWWTQSIEQPKHVVLTLQNFRTMNRDLVRHAKKCLNRLLHRKFCKNWKGGFYSLEVTNEGKGWHLHFHLLVDSRWIDASRLAQEWNDANGGWGYIVKVKDCRQGSYLAEVTKYACKGSALAKWSASEIATFIDSFTRVRTFGVFGSLYGKRTEWREWIKALREHGRVCKCGCHDFSYSTDMSDILSELKLGMPILAIPPPALTDSHQLALTLR